MSNHCYIAGAGDFNENALPGKGEYIIAANGGYAALKSRGISPDLIVGDFDSLPPGMPDSLSVHPEVIRYPAEKDDTDMMLAVKQGLDRGYSTFTINGGLGGRIDQTLANIQILVYIADRNARGILTGFDVNITAIKDTGIKLTPGINSGNTISIFSAGERAEGVTLKGLKYTLEDAVLTNCSPNGISNEFAGETAVISVRKGILIIVYPNDATFL